jgi:hypothetical protein
MRQGIVLAAVSSRGAVGLDRSAKALVGFDRSGSRVWSDRKALDTGATFTCLDQCPDAILSGSRDTAGPDPVPWRPGIGTASPFPVSAAHHRRVLTVRSPTDAVVEEGDSAGSTWLRLVRPDKEQRVAVPDRDYLWTESPDRSTALAFTRTPGAPHAQLRWFVRNTAGWRTAGAPLDRGQVSGACVADGGDVALLTGRDAAWLLDRGRRVPLRTDLSFAGECSIGKRGGAVLERSAGTTDPLRTAIRGIGLDGRQTWARDYRGEAFVASDPDGRRFALVHDGLMDMIDAGGAVLHTEPDVRSAMFTEAGELVVASLGGRVRWLPPH